MYREALIRDPNFALAAARLARSRLGRHWYVTPFTAGELIEIKSMVERSVALAPDLAEAHVSLALFYYWGKREYEAALVEFQRALDGAIMIKYFAIICAWIGEKTSPWSNWRSRHKFRAR